MLEETQDGQESLNTGESQDLNTDNNSEQNDQVAEELAKAKEIARNQKIRAEKAEAELKALKKAGEDETPKNENFTLKDYRALADVHDDDVEWLTKYAEFNKVSIADAKKREDVKVYLQVKAEQRQTAEVANIGESRRGHVKPSDDALLQRAREKGEPETDEEINALVEARLNQKLAKLKRT